jgi:hypothetical protein
VCFLWPTHVSSDHRSDRHPTRVNSRSCLSLHTKICGCQRWQEDSREHSLRTIVRSNFTHAFARVSQDSPYTLDLSLLGRRVVCYRELSLEKGLIEGDCRVRTATHFQCESRKVYTAILLSFCDSADERNRVASPLARVYPDLK